MSIDFDALVLGPCHTILDIGAICFPVATRPGKPQFAISGILTSVPVDVQMEGEAIFGDQTTTFAVRESDIERLPGENDHIKINEPGHPYHGRRYFISDVDDDGQGGTVYQLRTVT